MIAPSEKHLEDWIVSHLEDFANDDEWRFPYVETLVARQLRLPSGIADLVCIENDQLLVIELKRNTIDEAVLGQTLRYMADLKKIWFHAWNYGLERDGSEPYTYFMSEGQGLINRRPCEVGALIVGHGVAKQSIVDAAEGAGISIITYQYEGDGYWFQDRWFSCTPKLVETNKEFAYGAVGEAMRLVMKRRTEFEDGSRGGKYFDAEGNAP